MGFCVFPWLINRQSNIVEEWAIAYLTQNFLLFLISIFDETLIHFFKNSKFSGHHFLSELLRQFSFTSFLVLICSVLDRTLHGLSESLFIFDLGVCLCWKIFEKNTVLITMGYPVLIQVTFVVSTHLTLDCAKQKYFLALKDPRVPL
jgi:hypothetical protein